MILEYLMKYHLQDCISILSEKDNLNYYSIKIDFMKLIENYPDEGDKVLYSPIESLMVCDKDIIKAQQNILEQDEYKEIACKMKYSSLKTNVHCRFFSLVLCPELHRTVFPKNVDLGKFLEVTGTVVRVTQSKMLEYQRKYVCVKCKFENYVKADFENRYILKSPSKCGNVETRCKSSTFTQMNLVSREHCRDYQEIKIQEQVNKLSIGTIPGSMWVVLEDDLVDNCKPGDDVKIFGTVRRRWRPTGLNKKCEVELVLQANYLEVCNAQKSGIITSAPDVKECFDKYWSKFEACPMKGRDQILSTVCPQVYGLYLVKLAVLLTVITGSDHVPEDDSEKKCSDDEKHASRVRGQCHLLLVGDPGTGKSQLVVAAASLSARSVLTSGAGSSRAGLTCAALREDGEWQLEAGALVLSDGGVCCVDEIALLREHDRAAIHEAMEQQTISIAKAGIVCKLNTRSAVIGACNPKGHYATDQPLSANVSLGTPLLSRFDLIFILLESKNKSWDKLVSSYILFGDSDLTVAEKRWTIEKLQMYIAFIGPKQTEMTKSANIILQSYYMMQRKSEYRDPSRTTVRMLDSLVRLSQAHCRLMYRTTILPMDAIAAISLVDLSMQDCTLSDTVNALHSTFPKHPDFDYLCTARKFLTRLNLYEIWQEELFLYGKLLQVDHKTLESDIERGSESIFAKYDDVSDDNIQLSASLVTSSYFHSKKDKNHERKTNNVRSDKENFINDDDRNQVNNTIAETLKKGSAKNIGRTKPPQVIQKKYVRRKRKVVTLDTNTIMKKTKIIEKEKSSTVIENSIESDEDDFIDDMNLLNAMPSVNDFFQDFGIDLKLNSEPQDESEINLGNTDINIKECDIKYNTQNDPDVEMILNVSNKNKESDCHTKLKTIKSENINLDTSRTKNKLKLFQFKGKHDFTKYEEKVNKFQPSICHENIVKLDKNECAQDRSSEKSNNQKSVSSSQISMFECSDCDIDLDI